MIFRSERVLTSMQVDAATEDIIAIEKQSIADSLVARAYRLGFQVDEDPVITETIETWSMDGDLASGYEIHRLRGELKVQTRHVPRPVSDLVPEDGVA